MNAKTLVIGWDAADWKVIKPLLDQGKMPNLQRMMDDGCHGNIATLNPILSPTLWTSIATGKRPYKHGIHGFSEPDPVTGGIRPVTNLSRSTKAIWNILNQEGQKTMTVGWWPSNPAEPLSHGIMVSNDYQRAVGNDRENWPMKAGTVHPERLEAALRELRFHPSELTQDDVIPFLPGLEGMSREELERVEKDPRLQSLAKIIADCTTIHAAATGLLQAEDWDFCAVYYDAIDHFGHGFMKYHPPQRPYVNDFDYRVYNYVVEAGYRYHDMMFGALLSLAGDDCNVLLLSDHGFHPDDFRLQSVPREPAGPAAEHRQFGILVGMGPDIERGGKVNGASLLDICPTILHLRGLPVGEDMDGKVLHDFFKQARPVQTISSWDDVEGDHGMHPPDRQISAGDSKAALEQLVALGYIDKPDEDQGKAMENTVRELDYNLAQAYMDGGLYLEAVLVLERLYEKWPMEHRFGFQLASCYQRLHRTQELINLVALVADRRIEEANLAVEELKKLGLDTEEGRKLDRERIAEMEPAKQKKFSFERRELFGKARPNLFSLRYLEATAHFSEGNFEEALSKLEKLDFEYGARRNGLSLRGEILQKLRRFSEAAKCFEQALEFDREAPGPLLGLARTALAQRQFAKAAELAAESTKLLHFQPRAHYILGMAEYRRGRMVEAEQAFQICVKQTPLAAAALRMLEQIATKHHHDPHTALLYRKMRNQARQQAFDLRQGKLTASNQPTSQSGAGLGLTPELNADSAAFSRVADNEVITIVSGLPRSGTSLMMQLLDTMGLAPFTDEKRQADENNQKGYYEHAKVGSLMSPEKRCWVQDAQGKVLKVVAPLLASLPMKIAADDGSVTRLNYRVIFMERDFIEVSDSQAKMMSRLGTAAEQTERPADPARAYHQQVRNAKVWLNGNGIPAQSIHFDELISKSEATLKDLAKLFQWQGGLDELKAVIDPKMHRSRASQLN